MQLPTLEEIQTTGIVFNFNKPLTWTSFDAVNKVRHALKKYYDHKKLKVGHAGTLDPLADGVLIICAGKATKNIDAIQAQTKEYIAEITLGATTPSFDLETEINATFDTSALSQTQIEAALESFLGEQQQIPPIFSAKKIDGKAAYTLARAGKEVEMRPNSITIYQIELLSCNLPVISVRIGCSKGTYIRSIAHDLGQKLNNGAHLSKLTRTAVGNYEISNALNLEEFANTIYQSIRNRNEQKN